MSSEDRRLLEDVVRAAGFPTADRERSHDILVQTEALQDAVRHLLRRHPVRVILTSDLSTVSVAVESSCRGSAGPAEIEDLARAALAVLADGGYEVRFYPREGSADAFLEVVPVAGKPPRSDISLDVCVDALSGRS